MSGPEHWWWLAPLVGFGVSVLPSMGGVSGAFLLLPVQVVLLGVASPSVSATNLVFNIVGIPSGVWRYMREGRMVWPVVWAVVAGAVPGVVVGGIIRVELLPQPGPFKLFVGCVLVYIGYRLVRGAGGGRGERGGGMRVEVVEASVRRIAYRFRGRQYECSPLGIWAAAMVVGAVGGIYGIGGGALLAPILVGVMGLGVHTVAGAALMGTFVTSLVGVGTYQVLAFFYPHMAVAPQWGLGILFGLGGAVGMYVGARLQSLVPARWIRLVLAGVVFVLAGRYIAGYFWG